MVILENEIILVLTNLDSSSKVSRLKATFKNQGVIVIVFLLVVCLQLAVVSINLRDLGIEIVTLPRWPIRIVFPMVYWILFRWQFNKIIFVNVGGGVSLTLGSWEVYAVEHYLLSLRCVIQKFLLLLPGEFVTHRGIELVNWLKIFAGFLETRSVPQKWLLDTSTR